MSPTKVWVWVGEIKRKCSFNKLLVQGFLVFAVPLPRAVYCLSSLTTCEEWIGAVTLHILNPSTTRLNTRFLSKIKICEVILKCFYMQVDFTFKLNKIYLLIHRHNSLHQIAYVYTNYNTKNKTKNILS